MGAASVFKKTVVCWTVAAGARFGCPKRILTVKIVVNFSMFRKHSYAGHSLCLEGEYRPMGQRIGYARV